MTGQLDLLQAWGGTGTVAAAAAQSVESIERVKRRIAAAVKTTAHLAAGKLCRHLWIGA